VALPATRRQHWLERLQRAAHDPVLHADHPAPPHGLDHVRRAQPGQGQLAGFQAPDHEPAGGQAGLTARSG